MKFAIRNSSWLDTPDPAEAFEAVKTKAQWAEDQGFVWFSVMDHMIQIPAWTRPTSHSRKAGPPCRGWPLSRAVFVSPPWLQRSVIAIPHDRRRTRRLHRLRFEDRVLDVEIPAVEGRTRLGPHLEDQPDGYPSAGCVWPVTAGTPNRIAGIHPRKKPAPMPSVIRPRLIRSTLAAILARCAGFR
jgi:hypothetical protein